MVHRAYNLFLGRNELSYQAFWSIKGIMRSAGAYLWLYMLR